MLNYLKFLRVGRPPKYILSSAFKSRPKLFPEEEVATFSSWLVSMSTMDMLAVMEIGHFYLISTRFLLTAGDTLSLNFE